MRPTSAPTPSERLLAARRRVAHVERCRIVRDLEWHAVSRCWSIELELTHAALPPHLPARTRWCLLVDHGYPYGTIRMAPAKDGGLTATFPHQAVNDAGNPGVPWRHGDVCVEHPTSSFGRFAELMPDPDPHERLRWTVMRTLDWLDHAARGQLLVEGDPFELPSYVDPKRGAKLEIVVREDAGTLQRWHQLELREGIFDAVICDVGSRRLAFVVAYRDRTGRELWRLSDLAVRGARGQTLVRGFWARLERPPVLEPWQAPRTWAELLSAVEQGGDDLPRRFDGVFPRRASEGARLLLLGAPIPERVGGEAVELAWQALLVPGGLVRDRQHGKRRGPPRSLAASVLAPGLGSRPVQWLRVANWSAERLEARGRLDADLRSRRVVLLGAGALGCLVAELLVRGGVHELTIIDPDDLEVGNLVRHTLCGEDLHMPKAKALARRLGGASPHAHVTDIDARVPSEEARAAIEAAEIVIDCTAEDDVLRALGEEALAEPKRWLSAAVGVEARSLFVFMAQGRRFPCEGFFARMASRSAGMAGELRWEGPGCWSPVFPARMDEMALMAAIVVERAQALMERTLDVPSFEVFTRRVGADGRLARVELEPEVPSALEDARDGEQQPLPAPGSKRAWLGRWMAGRLLAWSERLEAAGRDGRAAER